MPGRSVRSVPTDWSGADYAEISDLQRWLADKSLSRLTLRGDETILDVGCGDGRITSELARRVPGGRVLGIDPAPRMLEFARAHHHEANLAFEAGDARQLESYRGGFDLVVSFNALHWLPEPREGVNGVRGCLKPGGRAHLRFVGKGPVKALEEVCEEVRTLPEWEESFQGFARPFTHLPPEVFPGRTDLQQERWDFGSRDDFARWCMTTMVNWTYRVPESSRRRFVDDTLDRYTSDQVFTFYQLLIDF